jgi:cytochrome c oxidase cbb3-type subunit III
MSRFWSLWIAVLVTANIVYAVWLPYTSSKRRKSESAAGAETTGHVWDGDLEEFNNPLPRWWLIGFYLSIVFAIGYLVLYPGFGAFKGLLGWTETGQWREQSAEANALYEQKFARFDSLTIDQLRADPEAQNIAHNLFAANCAMCHGSDARGAKGYPNLTSANLSWGNDADAIVATIGGGREGVMPPWRDALSDAGVDTVAEYVYTLSGRQATHPERLAAGKTTFETVCSACHGPDGKGNTALGAPNLTDEVWIYGGSLATIRETIAQGRGNRMPAHLERLGERKVRLLASYVMNLSPSRAVAATSAADHP